MRVSLLIVILLLLFIVVASIYYMLFSEIFNADKYDNNPPGLPEE